MSKDLSDVRKRAWITRRERYGGHGHNSSYSRNAAACSDCERMRKWLVRLHVEGILSEGQAAKATGMDRIDVRAAADAYTNSLPMSKVTAL